MTKEEKALEKLMTNSLIEDLATEPDGVVALRKTLLFCMILLSIERGDLPEVGAWALASLPALRGAFIDNRHALFGDVDVMLARSHRGGVTLALPFERIEKLLATQR